MGRRFSKRDLARRCASGEMKTDGFLNGRGQLAKILSLGGNATASGIVPGSDE